MSKHEEDSEVPVEAGRSDDSPSDSRGARRRILRTLVTGGGVGATAAFVPATWTKPVVDAVTLPAHAQTSAAPFNGSGVVGDPLGFRKENPDEADFQQFVQSVRDMVLPEASAGVAGNGGGGAPIGSCLSINVANLADPASPASVTLTFPGGLTDSGSGNLAQLQSTGIQTTGLNSNVIANVLNANGTGNGTVNGTPFTLTPGQCTPIFGED